MQSVGVEDNAATAFDVDKRGIFRKVGGEKFRELVSDPEGNLAFDSDKLALSRENNRVAVGTTQQRAEDRDERIRQRLVYGLSGLGAGAALRASTPQGRRR